jgi:hypothetical protein
MAGKQAYLLFAVQLLNCQPLALFPVNGQNPKLGVIFGSKNGCSTRPWGRRALIPVNGRCPLIVYSGQSASVLRDSAVYLKKYFF